MYKRSMVVLLLVLVGIACAGYYENFATQSIEYVTNPNTPTTNPAVLGLIDPTTGLAWVESWGATPDLPRVDNDNPEYRGSYFYPTAAVVLGEIATGTRINLARNAVHYVFDIRRDVGDDLAIGDPVGIEPWWSGTVSFDNGNFGLPTGMLVPDASFWTRLEGVDIWPNDEDEITLEWTLWSAIFLAIAGDYTFQNELDSIIVGIINSPFFDTTDGVILYGGVDWPYYTSLWHILLVKYRDAYGGFTYNGYIAKAEAYISANGLAYLAWLNGAGFSEGWENYEALAFMMSFALMGDYASIGALYTNFVLDDPDLWKFVQNILNFGSVENITGGRFFPMDNEAYVNIFCIPAFAEAHRFLVANGYYAEALWFGGVIRELADSAIARHWDAVAGRFITNPAEMAIVPTNGLAGYAFNYVPRLEIDTVVSNLPRKGPGAPGPDYYAALNQSHTVSVTVIAYHTIASNLDSVVLFGDDCDASGYAIVGKKPLPVMNPGDTAIINFNVTEEPWCPVPVTYTHYAAVLVGPSTDGYTVNDSDIVVEVQYAPNLRVVSVEAVADTIGLQYLEPYFTMGQRFYLEVCIDNTGPAPANDLTFTVDHTSLYGVSSTIYSPYSLGGISGFRQLYFEDFEATDGGYTPDPATGAWEWGAPTYGPPGPYSGVNCWGTDLDDDYLDGVNWMLISAPIYLPVSNGTILTFWHWYDAEEGWDGGNVKVSTDGGANWTIVYPLDGYDVDALWTEWGNPIEGQPAFTGYSGGWVCDTFFLTQFEGDTVYVKWDFGSDTYHYPLPGWYIDDVSILTGYNCYYLTVIADADSHGIIGIPDETFILKNVRGWNANNGETVVAARADSLADVGVVQPARLHVCGRYGWSFGGYYTTDGIPWLTRNNYIETGIRVYSEGGDFAVLDSLTNRAFISSYFHGDLIDGIFDNPDQLEEGKVWSELLSSPTNTFVPGDTVVFWEDLEAGVPEYEDTAEVGLEAWLHNAHRADAQYAEGMPLNTVLPHMYAIDVTKPRIISTVPAGSTAPWPAGDTIWVTASDAFSGVAGVYGEVRDSTGGVTASFWFNYWGGNTWYYVLSEPGGSYYLNFWAIDNASNWSDRYYLPRGSVVYLRISKVLTGLQKAVVPNEEWEADMCQMFACTVKVFNTSNYTINNIWIGLKSQRPGAGIWGWNGSSWNLNYEHNYSYVVSLAPLSFTNVLFYVQYDFDNFADTLVGWVAWGECGERVVGQQSTDTMAIVYVERPAEIFIDSTWVSIESAPVTVGDTHLVSVKQPFEVKTRVKYPRYPGVRQDKVDSLRVCVSNGLIEKSYAVGDTCRTLRWENLSDGEEILTFNYIADSTVAISPHTRRMEDLFDVRFVWFKFENWKFDSINPCYPPYIYDSLAFVSILEKPLLDIVNARVNGYQDPVAHHYWVNENGGLTVVSYFRNLLATGDGNGRATADRLDSYPEPLGMFTSSWTPATGLTGSSPLFRAREVDPGVMDSFVYYIDKTPGAYQGQLWLVDTLYWHDKNYPAQTYPWPIQDTIAPVFPEYDTLNNYLLYSVFVDYTKPTAFVNYPVNGVVYNALTRPESVIVLANDNYSGVYPPSVEWQLIRPDGWYWNGTGWQSTAVWLATTHTLADTYTASLPGLPQNGLYRLKSRCYDIAGNVSLVNMVQFIYDTICARSKFDHPLDGEFYNCSDWDGVIRTIAWDTANGNSYVAGVSQVYVAIEDLWNAKWWNGTNWVTYGTWIWLPMVYEGGQSWRYSTYNPPAPSYHLRVWTYAVDNVSNECNQTDTVDFIIDCQKPHSFIADADTNTPPSQNLFYGTTWTEVMGGAIRGWVIDTVTGIDDINIAIERTDLSPHKWWDGTGFNSDNIVWLNPDVAKYRSGIFFDPDTMLEFSPGFNLRIIDTMWYWYGFTPPSEGCYKVYVRSVDDLDNEELLSDVTTYNTWEFGFDNMGPEYVRAYRPYDGEVRYFAEWWDTVFVEILDTTPECFSTSDVESVWIWVQRVVSGIPYYWTGTTWTPIWTHTYLTHYGPNPNLWYLYLPKIVLDDDQYNVMIRAFDAFGNFTDYYYNFTLIYGGFLSIRVLDSPVWAGVPFRVEVAAYHTPGDINESFAYPCSLWSTSPNPSWVVFPYGGYPYWLTAGIDTIYVTVNHSITNLVLGVSSTPSGYTAGATVPFTVLGQIDEGFHASAYDNPNDQGDTVIIAHTRSKNDRLYSGGDIDTNVFYVLGYHYYRDIDPGPGTNWVELTPTLWRTSGDTLFLKVVQGGTFTSYDYGIMAELFARTVPPDTIFSNMVVFGPARPVDNMPPAAPQNIAVVQNGANARINWNAVVQGFRWNGVDTIWAPELPGYIRYNIYKKAGGDPYDWAGYVLVGQTANTWYDDPLPANPVATPTYYYIAAVDNDNIGLFSWRFGRTSYSFGVGYSEIGVPFDINFGSSPIRGGELATYLAPAGISAMFRYASGWGAVWWPPFANYTINEGSEALLVNAGATTTLLIGGYLMPAPVYSLVQKWNQIMVPLDEIGITNAQQLMLSVNASAVCSTVARRLPSGWEMLVRVPGGAFVGVNFPVYPGQAYMVYTSSDGFWPLAKDAQPVNIQLGALDRVPDNLIMPKAIVGEIKGGWEGIHFKLIDAQGNAVLTDKSSGCVVQEGGFMALFNDISWNVGEAYTLVLYDEETGASKSVTLKLDEYVAQYAGKFFLKSAVPKQFALKSVSPNPFNASTKISFDIPEKCNVAITIFDVDGRLVRELVNGVMNAGFHFVVWDGTDASGRDVPAGLYFCKMKAGDFEASSRMMLVK